VRAPSLRNAALANVIAAAGDPIFAPQEELWRWIMTKRTHPTYHLLTFDDDGRILPPSSEARFRSDAEAIDYCRSKFPTLTVEVWCGRRLAATVYPDDEHEEPSLPRSRWL
jgi:hypothetical protein